MASITTDQALALAPDGAATAAARKLAGPKPWRSLGRRLPAVWGECQGSALYQVRADLTDLAVQCSCPSRKSPCKHALALLLLAAERPTTLPEIEPPDWVAAWLRRRATAAQARPARAPAADAAEKASDKRGEKRQARVARGVETLDLWLRDLVRQGLAGVELQGVAFWESQAARLVDAQAPGLAGRVRRLASIPNASPDWPERLLAELGKLTLLTRAFRRLDALDPPLQEDVRQAIGWSLGKDDVLARGEAVRDQWAVLGLRVGEEERLRVQRIWLRGRAGDRDALLLSFAAAGVPLDVSLRPGTLVEAELVFWPSAGPQRAILNGRAEPIAELADGIPAADSLTGMLERVARQLARQPWLELFPCALRVVTPVRTRDDRWVLADGAAAVPLARGDHWRLLALAGGRPLDLAGEWDGEAVRPLGAVVDGAYHVLGGAN